MSRFSVRPFAPSGSLFLTDLATPGSRLLYLTREEATDLARQLAEAANVPGAHPSPPLTRGDLPVGAFYIPNGGCSGVRLRGHSSATGDYFSVGADGSVYDLTDEGDFLLVTRVANFAGDPYVAPDARPERHPVGVVGMSYHILPRLPHDDRDQILAELDRAHEDIRALRQALWDCYAASGADTDGDLTPEAFVGDLGKLAVEAVEDLREDYTVVLRTWRAPEDRR